MRLLDGAEVMVLKNVGSICSQFGSATGLFHSTDGLEQSIR
jgi:hypothetical protein